MSNLTDFFGAGAAPIPTAQFVIGESKTFTSPLTGRIKVIITGGGGQGAFVANSNQYPNQNYGDGTGGGAGGYSEKIFNVIAGDTFTVTIGAGGATTLAMDSISSTRVGNNGGNTTFVTASAAESVNMTANGGGGGQIQSGANTSAYTVAGGVGGTASGGDFNYTGGAGGSITRIASNNANAMTTGGGAVALYGSAYRGGNIDISLDLSGYYLIGATGGAGVGGNGGDIDFNVLEHRAAISSGGSATKSADSYIGSRSISTTLPSTSGGPTNNPTISIIDAQGSGSGGKYAYNASLSQTNSGGFGAGSGAGAGYNVNRTAHLYCRVYGGGGFGGGGACNYINDTTSSATGGHYAGAGGTGGGGSGAFNSKFHNLSGLTDRRWSPGGDGLCIIMFV